MKRQGRARISQSVILIAAVTFAAMAGAAQDTQLERCARLVSDAERLACFDAIVERRQESTDASPPAEQPAPGAVAAPDVEVAEQPSVAPPAAAQSEAAVRETPPPRPREPAPTSVQEASPPRENAPPTDKRQQPREYTATVVAIRERPHGQKVVTLDNGEVWSEQFASRAFLVGVGDTVTMKRGMLSRSYNLVAPGGRGYKMTRLDQ